MARQVGLQGAGLELMEDRLVRLFVVLLCTLPRQEEGWCVLSWVRCQEGHLGIDPSNWCCQDWLCQDWAHRRSTSDTSWQYEKQTNQQTWTCSHDQSCQGSWDTMDHYIRRTTYIPHIPRHASQQWVALIMMWSCPFLRAKFKFTTHMYPVAVPLAHWIHADTPRVCVKRSACA